MRTFIYKRTHCGDPDPRTGEFGNNDCMGKHRAKSFDAVIGIGGIGRQAVSNGIARKLTWIGIGPVKTGEQTRPKVTFDHFVYYGKYGRLLDEIAPALAEHMYSGKTRFVLDKLTDRERQEIDVILSLAWNAPSSIQLAEQNRGNKCR